MYCELTAQYWAWKNLHDVEYIEFCHYRRFFDINTNCIKDYLKTNDAIVLKYIFDHPIWREIVHFISIEDLTILMMVIKKIYPEYEKTMINYLYGNILYPKNMLICKKALFDQYAEWLFNILFECEKKMRPSSYTRGKRALAYMGEYLLPVYMMHNHYRLKIAGLVEHPGQHQDISIKSKIRKSLLLMNRYIVNHFFTKKPSSFEEFYLPEVLVGFKNDGIEI